jgi:exopolysaccharide biosynthesis WecB/TagA/CpsF family protein
MHIAMRIDDYDLAGFAAIAADFGWDSFGFVVTPNVDHLIRYHESASFRELYSHADRVLLDSRVLAFLLRLTKGISARVCPGSDLTAMLFKLAAADDRVVLIGGSDEQAQRLRMLYGLNGLMHYNPPMGFIRNADAIETCLQFIEKHSPFRFCFLAVGSPQQELLARELKRRGVARGLGLCVGASIDFMTGIERRAPRWMQRIGFEWLFRLLRNPGRMAKRYLLRGPRILVVVPQIQFDIRRDELSTQACTPAPSASPESRR